MGDERSSLRGETFPHQVPVESSGKLDELFGASAGADPEGVSSTLVGKDAQRMQDEIERRKCRHRRATGTSGSRLAVGRLLAQEAECVVCLLRRDETEPPRAPPLPQ